MTSGSYKPHFSRFLEASPGRLHFAAHSHHLWPDVSREAQLRAWDEAARHVDTKWGPIFERTLPSAQRHLARELGVADPARFAFAPNVHDLLVRLVSCIERRGPVRVLSTGSEFLSFTRQMRRWVEAGRAEWTRVETEPFATLPKRFATALAAGEHDLVYASHVFYDSGYVFDEVFELLHGAPAEALCCVDAYHGYLAVPTDLAAWQDRLFYTSGGYKYAMSGEGVCFLHCPDGIAPRPVDTGWFAGFGALENPADDRVGYAADGSRFLGATFDPSALYRFDAVQAWLADLGLDARALHEHSLELQQRFLDLLGDRGPLGLGRAQLVVPDPARRGNFLCFRRPDAVELRARLLAAEVVTDARADRLRFGFGLYQDPDDVDALVARLRELG